MIATLPEPLNRVSSPEDIEVTVVMPCLNEARTVGVCIDKARASAGEEWGPRARY